MLVGYARVSTQDQTLNLQKDALSKAGCEKIFSDTVINPSFRHCCETLQMAKHRVYTFTHAC